jgi:hypothetical protein
VRVNRYDLDVFLFFLIGISPLISACIIGLLIRWLIIKLLPTNKLSKVLAIILPLVIIFGYLTLANKASNAAFSNEMIRWLALQLRFGPIFILLTFLLFIPKRTYNYFKSLIIGLVALFASIITLAIIRILWSIIN